MSISQVENMSYPFNHNDAFMDRENCLAMSPTESFMNALPRRISVLPKMNTLKPFSTGDMKILLLENINQKAVASFREQGYQVESFSHALPEDILIEKIKEIHAIGIRSKTKLSANVLKHANNLFVIGCYCIGTDQVDLNFATNKGIAVFNSPFSNSRSVAELVLANIISLSRQLGERNLELKNGIWNNTSHKCYEVRAKTLGIVGYGHIGSQLSVLAEAMGLHIIYYDILNIMPLGAAKQVPTLNELLQKSDFVTLHVPKTEDTRHLLSYAQFAVMKTGSFIINSSRGSVVDTPALIAALKSKKLLGAALDVYPNEPRLNGNYIFNDNLNKWTSQLVSIPNVILTPHIGGATIESQSTTGIEVSELIANFITTGGSIGAVNFPEVSLKQVEYGDEATLRILYVHQNIPGALRTVNNILSSHNIEKQYSESNGDLSYMITDISAVTQHDIKNIYNSLNNTSPKVAVRLLY